MSLYLGTTEIYGVTTGDAAVSGVELPELTNPATAEDIIIGKEVIDANGIILTGTMSGGAEVIVGNITKSTTDNSITITDLIGKDNVVLMYIDSCDCPASAMEDSGIVNIIIHGESHSYNTHYSDGLYASSDDGFIIYDKTTGCISVNPNMSYNERLITGKYMYVVW